MATTTTEALVSVTRQPSERLHNAVTDIISHFGKLKDKVAAAITIGQEEGWTPIETGDLIRKELLAAGYHRSTVARMLPEDAKHMEKSRLPTIEFGSILRPNEYQSDQLSKYTKQFLIEIIHYLEGKQLQPQSPKLELKLKPKLATEQVRPKPTGKSPYSRDPVNKTSDDRAKQVIELHSQGKTFREIAKLTGVSLSSCTRILKR